MRTRFAFVDDMQAAKDFVTGDIVRRMGYREMLPGPFAGRVIYSNPNTGKVHVQWPWGDEEEPATELIRDISSDVSVNESLNSIYTTWESAHYTKDKLNTNVHDAWVRGLINNDSKWKKQLSTSNNKLNLHKIVSAYEKRTLPIWIATCKAWYDGLGELAAFKKLSSIYEKHYGLDAVRLTVSNLYGMSLNPDQRLSLYWSDNGRKYKVTKLEKNLGSFICPRCKGTLRSRVYKHKDKCLQCKDCGFMILPKDLVWNNNDNDDTV